jgi:hypothetical protein
MQAILLQIMAEDRTFSYCIKVEKALAADLGLEAEWTRLVEMCETGAEPTICVSEEHVADCTVVCLLSCATHQLSAEERAASLAAMRAAGDDIDVVLREELPSRTRRSALFAHGAPVYGTLLVWQ